MWSIPPPSLADCAAAFSSHAFNPLPALLPTLSSLPPTTTLHTLPHSPLFPALPTGLPEPLAVNADLLLPALHKARLIKDPFEVALMARAAALTSQAHECVMRALGRHAAGRGVAGRGGREGGEGERGVGGEVGEWEIEGEGDAEAVFVAACRRGGCVPFLLSLVALGRCSSPSPSADPGPAPCAPSSRQNSSKHLSYMPIIASGPRAATLHYVCNHASFAPTALPTTLTSSAFRSSSSCSSAADTHAHAHAHGADPLALPPSSDDWYPQILLIDAGTEIAQYGADVTRSMPVGNAGRFTPRARAIYELVLGVQKHCEGMTRAGEHWDEVHRQSHVVLARGLLRLGILVNSTGAGVVVEDSEAEDARVDELVKSGVTTAFYPHGLGHSIGLDVHDVPSSSLPSPNPTLPARSAETPALYAFLRLRLPLAPGMLVTIEPGCYFSPHLLAPWRSSDLINHEVLKEFEGVGGVRIEDVVLVEQDGCRNLTGAVREVEDVERLCSGA